MAALAPATPALAAEPAWFLAVRLRAQRRMLWCRELWSRHHYEQEQALAITHSEVERTLAGAAAQLAEELQFHAGDERARELSADIDALERSLADARWRRLCATLELLPHESALLASALAAELDPGLRRVYGYLLDELTALDPTPALIAALWCEPIPQRVGADSALVRWGLARPVEDGRGPSASSTGWIADPLVLEHLLARGRAPGRAFIGELRTAPDEPRFHEQQLDQIVRFVEALQPEAATALPLEVELTGPPGSGKTALAARLAARLGRVLIAVDSRRLSRRDDDAAAVVLELRRAQLDGALLLWRHAGSLPAELLDAIRGRAPLTLLADENPLPLHDTGATVRRSYALAPLDRRQRLRLWSSLADGPAPEPVADWGLRPREVTTAARVAPAGEEAVREVSARGLLDAPAELLSTLALPYGWEDLVVQPQVLTHLRELEAQARARGEVLDDWGFARLASLGRGVTALFAGPSGTGKTMAAQVLARALDLKLYRVDLAGVVNKYIGETEKHLRAVFAACERAPVMLFFDEADALFGRRTQVSDAHDRFANIEVDYLLQRMEQFDGVALLATNRKSDIDTAFLRRLRFVVDFAPPSATERERLWRLALEGRCDDAGRQLVGELDWQVLASELELTGAGIKSAALAAAFLARSDGEPIGARHVLAAARRELEKQGIVVRAGRLGAAES